MIPLKQLLIEYRQKNLSIPAFNIDCFEIYQAVEAAVSETKLPCLVQLSPGEDKFIVAERLYLLVKKAQADNLPIYLNMDHGTDLARLKNLIGLGFDMVHFDASKQDYDINLGATQIFVTEAKKINPDILVEAEFNRIEVVGTSVSPKSYTDPDTAREYLKSTNADLLAISIGNLHGVKVDLPENIDLDLLQKVFDNLPKDKFLTLHGGSGISPNQIASAQKLGIVKVNINTDLRLQYKRSLNNSLSSSSSERIYDLLAPIISDLKDLIIQKLVQFSNSSQTPHA
ncbi:MAG: class II fructose-bisphosphate aldolase [Candidatus Shapirobacteria bacterium]